MSNGGKRVILNTRERVISNDHNRLQDMIAQARAVQLSRLYSDKYQSHLPGYTSQVITGGQTPMVADVFGGLFVKVDDPTSLFIDPGVVGVVAPEVTPGLDDDPYKVVNDPGLQTAGLLTWLANASGNIRIDVVQATVIDQVMETDNRDIFDPSTGLFTPQTVNKVMSKRLAYSINRGTPGAGLPVLTNSIALVVVSVPDGSASWADCTFWDVRPLVQDRIGSGIQNTKRRYYDFDFYAQGSQHHGYAWAEHNGYRAGGKLMNTSVGADVVFDLNDPTQASNGAVLAGSGAGDIGMNPVAALFPADLPRWARYSLGAAPGLSIRAPYGPLGLIVAGRRLTNDEQKVDAYGNVTAMAIPPATGLVGTADGVLLYMASVVPNLGGVSVLDVVGTGRRIEFSNVYKSGFRRNSLSVTTGTGDQWIFFDITAAMGPTSREAGFSPNMVKFLFRIAPETIVDFGTPAPNSIYNGLTYYAKFQNILRHWGVEAYLNDGTTIPKAGTSPVIEMPVYHDAETPLNFTMEVGISGTVGGTVQIGIGSGYVFGDTTDVELNAVGYEV